jgi:hypothetical protein
VLGADIATDQTKPFNADVSRRKVFRSNHRRRVAPCDPSQIKPNSQTGVVRPEMPKWNKAFIHPYFSFRVFEIQIQRDSIHYFHQSFH